MKEDKPKFKREIEESGMTQKQWYGKVYLRSEHWKLLKMKKFAECGKKCEICGTKESIEVHHLRYRDIYDVQTSDLQVLCSTHHGEQHGHKKKAKKKKHQKQASKDKCKPFKFNEPASSIPKSWPDFRARIDILHPFESAQKAIYSIPGKHKNRNVNLLIKELRQIQGTRDDQMLFMRLRSLKNGKNARMIKAQLK